MGTWCRRCFRQNFGACGTCMQRRAEIWWCPEQLLDCMPPYQILVLRNEGNTGTAKQPALTFLPRAKGLHNKNLACCSNVATRQSVVQAWCGRRGATIASRLFELLHFRRLRWHESLVVAAKLCSAEHAKSPLNTEIGFSIVCMCHLQFFFFFCWPRWQTHVQHSE